MRQIPLNELSFLQLQIFLVAGEELNFTRTATRCHVTQPTVSRNIDSLEKITGLQLFNKDHSIMRLTPAGNALHQYLTKSWDMIHYGFSRAWEVQEGYRDLINISLPYGTTPSFIMSAAANYKKKNASIKTHYQIATSINQALHNLFSYEADVIITHMHNQNLLTPYSELNCQELIKTPLTAYMKRTNPLSYKRFLTFQDLQSQKILFPKNNSEPAYESLILEGFANANVVPTLSHMVSTTEEAFLNLQDDNEILILNHFVSYDLRSNYVEIPIKDTHSGFLIVTRTADAEKKLIQNFVDFIISYCSTLDYSMEE